MTISILLFIFSVLLVLWIIYPAFSFTQPENQEFDTQNSIEERYTRALIDLESDLLGNRISTDEFNQQKAKLDQAKNELSE